MIAKKGFLFFLVVLVMAGGVEAAPVTQEQAAKAVSTYLSKSPAPLEARMGDRVRQTRTFNRGNQDTPLFHVVALEGGGFVVTSADTGVSPIIAISESADLIESDENPLWVLLNRDLPQRMDALAIARPLMAADAPAPEHLWDELLAEMPKRHTGPLSIGDVRVAPLVQSQWSQSTVWTITGSKNVYNYYTPNNYVCGCVATAGAQILRFHEYPKSPVTPKTYTCWINGVATNMTMMGGTYDWENMTLIPYTPPYNISDDERRAIGKLTYDMSVASQMHYCLNGWDNSGAFDWVMLDGVKAAFGYVSGFTYRVPNGGTSSPADNAVIRNAVLGTLDAGLPAVVGISGNGGHAIVADGYGYHSGILYVHFNLGWGGSQDAWYDMSTFDVSSSYHFTILDDMSYNIHPTLTGEYITGRTLDNAGAILPGSTVTASNTVSDATFTAVSNDKGIYAVRVPSSTATYSVTAVNDTHFTLSATTVSVLPSVMVDYYWGGAGNASMYIRNAGQVGNRWGNDLTLDAPRPPPATVYVDISQQDDTGDGRTWSTAKKSIQAGIDTVAIGGTVIVTNGTYAPISTTNQAITIQSVNGADVTIIDGKKSQRCATLGSATGHTDTILKGFTLTNGHARTAGFYNGGGTCYGTLHNCVLSGNEATTHGGGAYYSVLHNCVVTGNTTGHDGGGAYSCTLNNCTLSGNKAYQGGGAYGSALNNCIVWGNTGYVVATNNHQGCAFLYSCSWPKPSGEGNIKADPKFADAANGDFRLQTNSPCINTGTNEYVASAFDLDGNPRILGGRVDMGAYEFPKTHTPSIPVNVPYCWLDEWDEGITDYEGYETLALSQGANGFFFWESFVAGLVPTNANSKFLITNLVVKCDNGKDAVATLDWTPRRPDRIYTVLGKTNLTDGTWHFPTNDGMRFFKVNVALP